MGWKIGRKIGDDPNGLVRETTSPDVPGRFALKRLSAEQVQDAQVVRRFQREVRIHASLDHPNIVEVVSIHLDSERPAFVMPRADRNLEQAIYEDDGLVANSRRAILVFRQVAVGMAYAHARGVIHRDLKPRNVLMFGDIPRITDFGLGKDLTSHSSLVTRTGAYGGTNPYAAPEQMRGHFRDAGATADIYALGKIFQELVTGRVPYDFEPTAPRKYHYFIRRATSRRPEDRYQSVEEMLNALDLCDQPLDPVLPLVTQAERLLGAISDPGNITPALRTFHEFIGRHRDEENMIRSIVPRLGAPAIKQYARVLPEEFETLIEVYAASINGSLDFDYCDTAANFLALAYVATEALDARQAVLRRLLEMGYSHNRWYVGDVAAAILCRMDDAAEIQMAVDVLTSLPAETEWISDRQQIREKGVARPLALVLAPALAR